MEDLSTLSWPSLIALLDDWTPQTKSPQESESRHAGAWEEIHRRLKHFAGDNLRLQLGLLRQDADDLAQATLLKLQHVVTWRRLKSSSSIIGYLHVMMRNQAIDLQRRRAKQAEILHELVIEAAGDPDREARELSFSLEALGASIASLAPSDQALIKMRFWRGLSLAEIATRLQLPYSTVAGRMFRILKKLRAAWNILP